MFFPIGNIIVAKKNKKYNTFPDRFATIKLYSLQRNSPYFSRIEAEMCDSIFLNVQCPLYIVFPIICNFQFWLSIKCIQYLDKYTGSIPQRICFIYCVLCISHKCSFSSDDELMKWKQKCGCILKINIEEESSLKGKKTLKFAYWNMLHLKTKQWKTYLYYRMFMFVHINCIRVTSLFLFVFRIHIYIASSAI